MWLANGFSTESGDDGRNFEMALAMQELGGELSRERLKGSRRGDMEIGISVDGQMYLKNLGLAEGKVSFIHCEQHALRHIEIRFHELDAA